MKIDVPPAYVDPVSGRDRSRGAALALDTRGPLMITALPGIGRNMIDTGKRSLWRQPPLPVKRSGSDRCERAARRSSACTMGRRPRFCFKLEWLSPTGSFKDRKRLRDDLWSCVARAWRISAGRQLCNGGAAIAA